MTVQPISRAFRSRDIQRQPRSAVAEQVADDPIQGDLCGLWRSQGGSIYLCAGSTFVCVAVHSAAVRGWINRVAVKGLRRVGEECVAEQAFRNNISGALVGWESIRLQIARETIVKYFPPHIPREILVYGYVEEYTRVRIC